MWQRKKISRSTKILLSHLKYSILTKIKTQSNFIITLQSCRLEIHKAEENDGIVINPTLGKLQISISADRTNKMFYPKSAYDLVLIDPSVNKTRLLEGYMTLSRSVTI
jgi:hypothetical protein